MSKHPERNWSIILQQAWSLHLREKPVNLGQAKNSLGGKSNGGGYGPSPKPNEKPCRRYNGAGVLLARDADTITIVLTVLNLAIAY